ncbi:MAG TPA: UDP-3-O-(3-hydroxymyristoyl)glucosamine N-acyltransferase [Pirellulales bacterium]|nr:UDP-3-O-(3-hydroxymyristoyl)glucosamine N-acyltransferase [Pirellulales bacterium]
MAVGLAELANMVGGATLGDCGLAITGAATLADARPGDITFVNSADKAQRLGQTAASAVVVPRGMAPVNLPAIQVDNVAAAFAVIVRHFRPPRAVTRAGVSPRAVISPSARLGDDVEIHPGATIGDDVEIGAGSTIHAGARVLAGCKLGEKVTVFPNAVLYENTIIGPRSTIHANAVLGGFGFGYTLVDGRHQLSAQLGHVEIGADVEIGAGTTIDRGTYGPTVVGEGTKIDNLVMIAHNCRLGRHNLICSQVGIAGSTTTGDYVTMAGQVGVRDHVHIGDRAVLGAQAGVPNDVAADIFVFGSPARPMREQKVIYAAIARLPDMRQELKALRAAVARLEAQAGKSGHNAAA